MTNYAEGRRYTRERAIIMASAQRAHEESRQRLEACDDPRDIRRIIRDIAVHSASYAMQEANKFHADDMVLIDKLLNAKLAGEEMAPRPIFTARP